MSTRETAHEGLANDPIPRWGITIAGIDAFIAAIGGEKVTVGLSTARVSEEFLLPLTLDKKCAFAALLNGDPLLVGQANVFVSHAWGMKFNDLIACLRDYASAAELRPLFWLDILVNCQHSASAKKVGVMRSACFYARSCRY